MKSIQSRDNPFFKELVKLTGSARQRNKTDQTLLDGAHLLAAYLDSGNQPRHILLNGAAMHNAEIAALLQRISKVPVTQLDDKLFAELSELKTPTGILALIDLPRAGYADCAKPLCLVAGGYPGSRQSRFDVAFRRRCGMRCGVPVPGLRRCLVAESAARRDGRAFCVAYL